MEVKNLLCSTSNPVNICNHIIDSARKIIYVLFPFLLLYLYSFPYFFPWTCLWHVLLHKGQHQQRCRHALLARRWPGLQPMEPPSSTPEQLPHELCGDERFEHRCPPPSCPGLSSWSWPKPTIANEWHKHPQPDCTKGMEKQFCTILHNTNSWNNNKEPRIFRMFEGISKASGCIKAAFECVALGPGLIMHLIQTKQKRPERYKAPCPNLQPIFPRF